VYLSFRGPEPAPLDRDAAIGAEARPTHSEKSRQAFGSAPALHYRLGTTMVGRGMDRTKRRFARLAE